MPDFSKVTLVWSSAMTLPSSASMNKQRGVAELLLRHHVSRDEGVQATLPRPQYQLLSTDIIGALPQLWSW